MSKILKAAVLLQLIYCTHQSYGAGIIAKVEAEPDKFFLVHATSRFPNDNQLIIGTSINVPTEEENAFERRYFSTEEAPLARISLHFSLNCLVSDHKGGTRSDRPYIILIPLIDPVTQKIFGGFAEDIFLLGPYYLPSGSIILAPLHEQSQLRETQFVGRVIFYETGSCIKDIVNNCLQELGAHPVKLHADDKLEYKGRIVDNSEFLAPLISSCNYFEKTYHSQTYLFTIENCIKELSQPLYYIAVGRGTTFECTNSLIYNLSLIETAFKNLIEETKDAPLLNRRIVEWQEEVTPWLQIFKQDIIMREANQKSLFCSTDLVSKMIRLRNQTTLRLEEKIGSEEIAQLPLISQAEETNMQNDIACGSGSYQRLLRALSDLIEVDQTINFSSHKLYYLLHRTLSFADYSEGLMHENTEKTTSYLLQDFASVPHDHILEEISVQVLRDIFEPHDTELVNAFFQKMNSNVGLKQILGKFLKRPEWEHREVTRADLKQIGVNLTKDSEI